MALGTLTDLRGLLDGTDLAAVRAARLRSLPKARKRALDETLESLDALIAALDEREEAIARGEADSAEPAPDPGKDRESRLLGREGGLHDTLVLPAVTESDLAERELEPEPEPAVVPEPEPTAALELTPEAVATEVRDDYEEMAAHGATAAAEEPMAAPVPEPLAAAVNPADTSEMPQLSDEAPTPGWTRPAELLFDDALRLFRMGDSDGALISLERLLSSQELNADLSEFVRVNQDRLLDLYAAIVGPWEKIPTRHTSTEPMPHAFYAVPKIAGVLAQIDGRRSMADLMESSAMTRLETVAVLNQLIRAKAITTESTLH